MVCNEDRERASLCEYWKSEMTDYHLFHAGERKEEKVSQGREKENEGNALPAAPGLLR